MRNAAKKRHGLALALLLLAGALLGAFYEPPANGFSNRKKSAEESAVARLPLLPRWAKAPLPDFTGYADSGEKKAAFFNFLFPRIVLANSHILLERQYLDALAAKTELTDGDKQWLETEAKRLRLEPEPVNKALITRLKKRLDVIPPSLVMAQAAVESGWGSSRFAVQANNLFGQQCFAEGCGLVPHGRSAGANHELARFGSPYLSVRAYMQNLNRHPSYKKLRDIRLAERQQQQPLSGSKLANGLTGYSVRGQAYISDITALMRFNKLAVYDQAFMELLQDGKPQQLRRLASAGNIETLLLPQNELFQNPL